MNKNVKKKAEKEIKERTNDQRFASAIELSRQRGWMIQSLERKQKRIGDLVWAIPHLEVSEENERTMIEAVAALLKQDQSEMSDYYNRTTKVDPACYVCGCEGCESVCNEELIGRAREYAEREGKLGKKCCGHEWGKDIGVIYGDLPF